MPADTVSSLRLKPHFEKLLRCANIGVVDGLSCEKQKKKEKKNEAAGGCMTSNARLATPT